jgi:two-component system sensor histidine kinase RegB
MFQDVEARAAHDFAWLVRMRWGAIVGQLAIILLVELGLGLPLALSWLLPIVALTALTNLGCELWQRRGALVADAGIAAIMALDYVLLTGLLYAAGGPSNPFSVLYLVHVALAAALLRAGFAWALALLSTALFGLLFLLPVRHDAVLHALGMHHASSGDMGLHFQGMWVAFAIAAFAIVHFVTRMRRALARERAAAAQARARALHSEKLASLATLAAGAAHELGTPLSTIAVAAGELERSLREGALHEDALLDVQAMRADLERCKRILAQLAPAAGEITGEAFDELPLPVLMEQALDVLPERERVRLSVPEATVEVPRRALAQALRALIKNALEASADEVRVALSVDGELVAVEVRDAGPGMSADVLSRVGEPFFTTKATGRGMGLGVVLARALLERLGGELTYRSDGRAGTAALASFRARLSPAAGRAKVPSA